MNATTQANDLHRCPQCGDPTYLKGWPCDGCWHQGDDTAIDLGQAIELEPVGFNGLPVGRAAPWDDPRPLHVED